MFFFICRLLLNIVWGRGGAAKAWEKKTVVKFLVGLMDDMSSNATK